MNAISTLISSNNNNLSLYLKGLVTNPTCPSWDYPETENVNLNHFSHLMLLNVKRIATYSWLNMTF